MSANGPFGLGRGFALDDLAAIQARCHVLPWTGCWIWMGQVSGDGYARVERGRRRIDRKILLLHRVVCAVSSGIDPLAIDPSVCAKHSCDTPPCVCPDHLSFGTWEQNVEEAIARGRHAVAYAEIDGIPVGRCAHGHDLTVFGISVDNLGRRTCLECKRIRGREWQRRNYDPAKAHAYYLRKKGMAA